MRVVTCATKYGRMKTLATWLRGFLYHYKGIIFHQAVLESVPSSMTRKATTYLTGSDPYRKPGVVPML